MREVSNEKESQSCEVHRYFRKRQRASCLCLPQVWQRSKVMTFLHKPGWFWFAFVLWLFITVVLMHGCTPLKKAEAEESQILPPLTVDTSTRIPYDIWYRQQMTCQYVLVAFREYTLSQGETALNELAAEGWKVFAADWERIGTSLQGVYTLERCE
jgi:hypothetical protein